MKPKPNKNLSLPWATHREKASGNHQILLPKENKLITISLSGFVFPGVLNQFFDLADRTVVNDT